MYFMISDRNTIGNGLGRDLAPLTFWTATDPPLDQFKSWRQVTKAQLRNYLARDADKFPLVQPENNEQQKHVTFFVHGYNNNWADAARRYQSLCEKLFSGADSLGYCVLFSWPSDGMKLGYLPDRYDALKCAPDLAQVLSDLYDWMLDKQAEGAANPRKACRAKVSMIAHSMGNYLLQKAMQSAWTRSNQPLLVSLINQLLMVAADVDNDLFAGGEQQDKSDGNAIANLTYRVTALYGGLDSVLGMSAGLKHFGKRRLGRSGLDRQYAVSDNIWDIDCSRLFPPAETNIHSAYFDYDACTTLMRQLLTGVDRTVLRSRGLVPEPLLGIEKAAVAAAGMSPASSPPS
jgi:esterase/lipase superfamily enzyme